VSNAAEQSAEQSSPGALSGVFDYWYSVVIRDFGYAHSVGGVSVQVRHDDCVNTAADHGTHGIEIRTKGRWVKVVEPYAHPRAERCGSKVYAPIRGICDGPTGAHDFAKRKDESRRSTVSQHRIERSIALLQR